MGSRVAHAPLTDALETFEQTVHGLAMELVRAIVREEFRNRIDQLKASIASPTPTLPGVRRAKRRTAAVRPIIVPPPPPEARTETKRGWTRDAIVSELASWLASGTTIDASFVNRHGPRGLVAASKREFGRFDAALNVASLRVASLYPDKPTAPAQH